MQIRRANSSDIEGINKLLNQVHMVHHNGRLDIFKANVKKYTDEKCGLVPQKIGVEKIL